VWTGNVAADDKLLPVMHAVFDPGAPALPRLLAAVSSFRDDAFQAVARVTAAKSCQAAHRAGAASTRKADRDRLILIAKTEVWRFQCGYMKQSLLALGALLFAGLGLSFSPRSSPQETNEPYKITPEDVARTNPVKPTPEGLEAAHRVFGYDCAQGDGKGCHAEGHGFESCRFRHIVLSFALLAPSLEEGVLAA